MSSMQRISSFVQGVIMLICAAIFIAKPEDGCYVIALLLALSLILSGVRELVYYFTMARHMVGGKMILFIGVFLVDVGSFSLTVIDESRFTVLLYLFAWYAFSGVVKILRALEAKRNNASSWRMNALSGVLNLLIALSSTTCINSPDKLSYLYSFGLICSGIVKIASSFRRTSIVYIQ